MSPLPLQQHPRFAKALISLGQKVDMADLSGAGHAQVIRRTVPILGEIGYVPRGPIWEISDPGLRRAALSRLSDQGVRMVDAESCCPSLLGSGFRQVVTPTHVAELSLSETPKSRRHGVAPKWRGSLKVAERSNLRVVWESFDGDPSHWLLRQEAAMRARRRYRALPLTVACAFAKANPNSGRIFAAWAADEPVAGMLFLLHPPVATYHIGWSGDRGRALSAHHLLLMRAADDLAAEGYIRLDLGTVDTEASPGLARFKIGAGATVRALGGSWLRLPFAGTRG
ncbi:GNAT family N-acetyltransferase [Rubellimicrobium rubrum]|uniref:GNAT family N-acetyltransferase n=1 Tax=Rubellimicrobium rubrum TaxID=2585369 RepID=A0A5C4N1Y5_9RHOB|nr:GNAT family N-acetyltransferase [Rubellimicrobium rubrum]TNC50462.1 GNAT family N-acetyltransferase [Rubellimicrobium rubrum]